MKTKPEPVPPTPLPTAPGAGEPAREALAWIRALANAWEDERERAEQAKPPDRTSRR